MSQKIQQEQEKLFNQDPWKVKATKVSQPFYESEMDPTQPGGNDRIVALPNYKAFLPISNCVSILDPTVLLICHFFLFQMKHFESVWGEKYVLK
jgi:hypothetical protein